MKKTGFFFFTPKDPQLKVAQFVSFELFRWMINKDSSLGYQNI